MKGTPSRGKHTKRTHVKCKRCGFRSFNIHKKTCAKCGYGNSAKLRKYRWQRKYAKNMSIRK